MRKLQFHDLPGYVRQRDGYIGKATTFLLEDRNPPGTLSDHTS